MPDIFPADFADFVGEYRPCYRYILDTDAAAKALISHRNTPTQDTGIPPSVMLFGCLLRDLLPQSNRELRPEWGVRQR